MLDRAYLGSAKHIVLLAANMEFAHSAQAAFAADIRFKFTTVVDWQSCRTIDVRIANADVVIVDLSNAKDADFSALSNFMTKAGQQLPFVAILDEFNETLVRKLVQMRVCDLLVKPVSPRDIIRGCLEIIQKNNHDKKTASQVHTFLPVAGGVGTTTLAIESAMILNKYGRRRNLTTCLIDLNFHDSACADYLEIEPRFNLKEIELAPDRLDGQLLATMQSGHSSGLAVVAAQQNPTEVHTVNQNAVMALLNVVCQSFDHVVIDMPRLWHSWTDNVVLGSNELFLVTETSVPGIRRARQLSGAISARHGHGARPRVIVNRFERHIIAAAGLRRGEIGRALGESFVGTVPYNRRLVKEAIDRGVALEEVQKRNNVTIAMEKLILSPSRAESKDASQIWPGLAWVKGAIAKRSVAEHAAVTVDL